MRETLLNGKIYQREYYDKDKRIVCLKLYTETGDLLAVHLNFWDSDGVNSKKLDIDQSGSVIYSEINVQKKYQYLLNFYYEAIPGQQPLLEGNLEDLHDGSLLERPNFINRLLTGSKKLEWVRLRDKTGLVLRQVNFTAAGDTASVQEYMYTPYGKDSIVKIRQFNSDPPQLWTVHSYSDKGTEIARTVVGFSDAGIADTIESISYSYSNGLLSEEISNQKDKTLRTTYTYDKQGNLLSETRYESVEGEEKLVRKNEMTYDQQNNLSEKADFLISLNGTRPYRTFRYTYEYK